ncbi:MAG: shikimate kinase [Alistipes sp.]|nr:shikimate kinase [Candidatus Alistipes equi]
MRIFLIGYMCSGKSFIGRKLAQKLGLDFIDTDDEVERREGAEVADVINYEGEDYFRNLEHEILMQLIKRDNILIATGGGLPIWGNNMDIMLSKGFSIYLRRPASQILSRLTPYGRYKRPKLRGKSDDELKTYIENDIEKREPVYMRSNLVLDCVSLSDADILQSVKEALNDKR